MPDAEEVINLLIVALTIYIFYKVAEVLLPLIMGTEFGRSIIQGILRGVAIVVVIFLILLFIYSVVSE